MTSLHATSRGGLRLATFDLEGTCVDLEAFHFLAFEHAMQEMDLTYTSIQIAKLPGAVGGGDAHIASLLASGAQVDAGQILASKDAHFDRLVREQALVPRAGMIETLINLKAYGFLVAIGSLTARDRGETILKKSGLMDLFPASSVFFKEDVRAVKPSPEVYLRAAREAGIDPREQIVFEDSATGITAAKAAGSFAVAVPVPLFQHEPHLSNLHRAGADALFTSWTDIDLDRIFDQRANA